MVPQEHDIDISDLAVKTRKSSKIDTVSALGLKESEEFSGYGETGMDVAQGMAIQGGEMM